MSAQVVKLVNAERKSRGLPSLRATRQLRKIAHYRATDMVRRDYFAHRGMLEAFKRLGYWRRARTIGENIAKGQDSAKEAFEDWMDSPGHRENILARKYTEIGVARVEDIWIQCFGSRR